MAAIFVSKGNAIDYTPTSDVEAGTIVVQGKLVGVAAHNIAANTLGAIDVKGVFRVEKNAATDTFSVGDVVYLNSTKKAVTADAGSGVFGICVSASANGDAGVDASIYACVGGSTSSSSAGT